MTAGAAGAVAVSQLAKRTPTPLFAIGQALTPVLAGVAVPAAVMGVVTRRPALTACATASAVTLAATVAPALRRPTLASGVAGECVTVAHANMLYTNHRHARDAVTCVLATDADVLALSEVTPRQERELAQLAAGRYPHRFSRPAVDSHGLAIWSKFPLGDVAIQPLVRRPGIVVDIEVPWGDVRMVFAHPDPPTKWRWFRQWEPSLRTIGELGSSPGHPTLIVADLNATRWHPAFRRLLDGHWRDAHEAVGRGLSTSWSTLGLVPSFVRLDHALVSGRRKVRDVDIVALSQGRQYVLASFVDGRARQVASRDLEEAELDGSGRHEPLVHEHLNRIRTVDCKQLDFVGVRSLP